MKLNVNYKLRFSINSIAVWVCLCLSVLVSNLGFAESQKMKIVVSIEPLAIIIRDLVGLQADVQTIAAGAASPHHYALAPSQLQQLHDADLIVWIDPHFEFFMAKIMTKLSLKSNKVLQISSLDKITWPQVNDESAEQGNVDDHEHAEEHDFHFWLNPENVKVMANNLKILLNKKDMSNLVPVSLDIEKFNRSMDLLITELKASLFMLGNKKYAAFHDAYGHFSQAFNLQQADFVAKVPDERISGKRLLELKASIADASCLIADLSEVAEANKISQRLNVSVEVVDVLGVENNSATLTYSDYLRRLAAKFIACMQ